MWGNQTSKASLPNVSQAMQDAQLLPTTAFLVRARNHGKTNQAFSDDENRRTSRCAVTTARTDTVLSNEKARQGPLKASQLSLPRSGCLRFDEVDRLVSTEPRRAPRGHHVTGHTSNTFNLGSLPGGVKDFPIRQTFPGPSGRQIRKNRYELAARPIDRDDLKECPLTNDNH